MTRTFPKFGYDPITGEWNDSLAGEFLWSSVNTREAIPDVMTPSTWSLWQIYYVEANPIKLPEQYPFCGNIGGRPYLNLSLIVSMYRAVGKDIREEMHGDIIGSAQSDLDIPIIPFSPLSVIWMVLPGMLKARRYATRDRRALADFLSATPCWCRAMRAQIQNTRAKESLLRLWKDLKPYFAHACNLLRSVTMQYTDPSNKLRRDLAKQIGEAGANALMSHINAAAANLESLMPLVGLSKIMKGGMSREEYMERYGHRNPHELELFAPGSDEIPGWLDQRLADAARNNFDAEARLAGQRAEWEKAWRQYQARFPREAKRTQYRLTAVAEAARRREAVRSEVTRLTRLIRQFLLRMGEATGLGEGVFFLSLPEMANALVGDESAKTLIPARHEMYLKYSALPPYPSLIIGKFDPFQWAADPNRRSDYFDARSTTHSQTTSLIKGFAGAAGCVEGIVRRIDCVEEGQLIQPGEILVTVTTNVGWTPLFPRLAAIVTDVGAPLSHAAIVAREMGIPAVVGCGNATMLLKTGDRIRVDGGVGTVTLVN